MKDYPLGILVIHRQFMRMRISSGLQEKPPETSLRVCPSKWPEVRYDFDLKYATLDRDRQKMVKNRKKSQKIVKNHSVTPVQKC